MTFDELLTQVEGQLVAVAKMRARDVARERALALGIDVPDNSTWVVAEPITREYVANGGKAINGS